MKKISLLVFWILILSDFAFADVSTNNNAQSLLSIFSSNANAWIAAIIPYAKSLFWYLVVIDWVITFSMMALKGTDFNEIMAGLIQKTLLIGFFLMMFQYASWLDTIPKSFAQMANGVTGVNIQPDTILEQGYSIVGKLWESTSWFSSPGDSLGLMIAGIVILLAFIVMTANLFMVLVKLYLLITGAYFMLALGGLSYTRTMGFTAIIAVGKAGFELFFLKLILGFSVVIINQMAANVGTDNNSVMAMIGTAVLIAYLTSMVGGLVESLTNGTLGGNGNLAGGSKNAMQGAAQGAVGGAVGAASSVAAAKATENLSQAASASVPGMGGSGNTTGAGTGKMGNFMNSAKSAAKMAGAVVGGAALGASSGAVKGMVGIGTHSAGRKSGSGFVSTARGTASAMKTAKEAPEKLGEKIADKIMDNKSSNTNGLNGTISKGSDNKSSSYVSGVPSGSGGSGSSNANQGFGRSGNEKQNQSTVTPNVTPQNKD